MVRGDGVLQKLFGEMAERYRDREGGYTRILRTRRRANDAAHMAYIECAAFPSLPSSSRAQRLQRCRSRCMPAVLAVLQHAEFSNSTSGLEHADEHADMARRCRYVDRDGEMRPARPPVGRAPSLLPAAAQALEQQQAGDSTHGAG